MAEELEMLGQLYAALVGGELDSSTRMVAVTDPAHPVIWLIPGDGRESGLGSFAQDGAAVSQALHTDNSASLRQVFAMPNQ